MTPESASADCGSGHAFPASPEQVIPGATVLRIAVPSPLRQSFDYLPPLNYAGELLPGMRLKVPFGRAVLTGILLELATDSRIDCARLKPVLGVLDSTALLPAELLQLMLWASAYYHHPPGEVVLGVLPGLLRQGKPARLSGLEIWQATSEGLAALSDALRRAPRQAALLRLLQGQPAGLPVTALPPGEWRQSLYKLISRGWASRYETASGAAPGQDTPDTLPQLNAAQYSVVQRVSSALGGFQAFLLEGVTGSGKTEIYLRLITAVLNSGRQALVLAPEIGLTPQLVQRFRARFRAPVVVLHSGLSEQERLNAWLMARDGSAAIVLGTRSAVFTPLHDLGIIIIDEEHDLSFKQQDGFRYHARDVAVMRARNAGAPVVLGSATPSLESLYNVQQGRYVRLSLPERAGNAQPPAMQIVDIRRQKLEGGISPLLLQSMRQQVEGGEQALLFLNRRGYAPCLICHACGWLAACNRCAALMVVYQGKRPLLRCHHCAAERALNSACPVCASADLQLLGQGTERVAQALAKHFPESGVVRIDRDTTRRKGALEGMLDEVQSGRSQLLIGTQMLAKGHHFPNVTLVGILDADQGLFGVDFRSPERMAQLIVQVAGRAGRGDKSGQVIIQTRHPEHLLLRVLLMQGYVAFARAALEERRLAQLPPYSYLALLRASSVHEALPLAFLDTALSQAQVLAVPAIQLFGPVTAPMPRRAGRYRAQLLVQAPERAQLQRFLSDWIPLLEALKTSCKVRWSIDVDAQEMG